MHIIIENKSSLLDSDGRLMVHAIQTLLPIFCSDWNLEVPELTYLPRTRTHFFFNPTASFITITDAKQIGTHPAFHSVENGKPFGTVFAASILKQKNPAYAISKFLCHEVFEMMLNPKLNRYISGLQAEICDPVQLNTVLVNGIQLSDWVLPSWFDSNSKRPYNHNDTLVSPKSIDTGGYIYK